MPTIDKSTPKRPWVPETKPFTMKVNNQKFYNSAAWRKCAKAHKKAHHYLCKNFEECRGVAAFTNHNPPLIELVARGLNPLDWQYLEDLCTTCNASTTGKQGKK